MSKLCGHCGQTVTDAWIAYKKKQRSENVSKGLLKAKAEGITIGRPKKVDYEKIRKLRAKGISHRTIAKQLGCSLGSVSYALKEPL